MNDTVSRPTPAVDRVATAQLNRECFCVTLDPTALSEALRTASGDAAFANLIAHRPHPYSHAPVFLPKSDAERTILLNDERVQRKLDVRLYTYAGEVLLGVARLYQGQITNFRTPGGGFAPVFFV